MAGQGRASLLSSSPETTPCGPLLTLCCAWCRCGAASQECQIVLTHPLILLPPLPSPLFLSFVRLKTGLVRTTHTQYKICGTHGLRFCSLLLGPFNPNRQTIDRFFRLQAW
uniref:Putative secreted protein n=1 Tax=Anopheles marajoara TaxID=58244 RepID=A0A2M4C7Y3_9DIPT